MTAKNADLVVPAVVWAYIFDLIECPRDAIRLCCCSKLLRAAYDQSAWKAMHDLERQTDIVLRRVPTREVKLHMTALHVENAKRRRDRLWVATDNLEWKRSLRQAVLQKKSRWEQHGAYTVFARTMSLVDRTELVCRKASSEFRLPRMYFEINDDAIPDRCSFGRTLLRCQYSSFSSDRNHAEGNMSFGEKMPFYLVWEQASRKEEDRCIREGKWVWKSRLQGPPWWTWTFVDFKDIEKHLAKLDPLLTLGQFRWFFKTCAQTLTGYIY